jgi:hypothetical protein
MSDTTPTPTADSIGTTTNYARTRTTRRRAPTPNDASTNTGTRQRRCPASKDDGRPPNNQNNRAPAPSLASHPQGGSRVLSADDDGTVSDHHQPHPLSWARGFFIYLISILFIIYDRVYILCSSCVRLIIKICSHNLLKLLFNHYRAI